MREFLDERKPAGLTEYSMSIEDKTFESTIAVDRKAIEDDQLDLIRLRVKDLAWRVAAHRQQILVELFANGFTTSGYDGVSFFNTAHPITSSTTYSNRSTAALSANALADAISTMMLVPDDQGTPLGIVPDTLVVGPKLQWAAMELVDSPVVVYKGNAVDSAGANNYANVFKGKLDVVVSHYLGGAWDDYWFLLDTKRPIRSAIFQQRSDVPVEISTVDADSGSESAFMRDRFYYGIRARYNVGFGQWQTAYGAIL
jgi:phage major head subunit gpT-like protein